MWCLSTKLQGGLPPASHSPGQDQLFSTPRKFQAALVRKHFGDSVSGNPESFAALKLIVISERTAKNLLIYDFNFIIKFPLLIDKVETY